jgi:hypothetical protein
MKEMIIPFSAAGLISSSSSSVGSKTRFSNFSK